jgi:predicted acylesterase/phospholipase RssA
MALSKTVAGVFRRLGARPGWCAAVLVLLSACAGTSTAPQTRNWTPREYTEAEFARMVEHFDERLSAELKELGGIVLRRMEREGAAHRTTGEAHVRDLLLISSGGEKGAFAAGFLEGWGSVTGEHARPEFDVVTGVSTGALIAPFAFIGTRESYASVASFYADPQETWIKHRGVFYLLPGHVALFHDEGLQEYVREVFGPELVEEVAEAASEDRILLVGATNLDLGRGRVFDLGSEARAAHENGDRDRFHSILLASSAIPGIFPPIEMEGFYYVDGGVTAQTFVLSLLDHLHEPVEQWLRSRPEDALPRIRIWAIVNEQIETRPSVVKPRWTEISSRSLGTLMRSSLISSLQLIEELASEARQGLGLDVEFRFVAIPEDAPAKSSSKMFEKEYMLALEELGRSMGADPASWRTTVPDMHWSEP